MQNLHQALTPPEKARRSVYPTRIQIPSPLNPNFSHHRSAPQTGSSSCDIRSPTEESPLGTIYHADYFRSQFVKPRISALSRSPQPTSPARARSDLPASTARKDRKPPPKLSLPKVVHVYAAEADASVLRNERTCQRRRARGSSSASPINLQLQTDSIMDDPMEEVRAMDGRAREVEGDVQSEAASVRSDASPVMQSARIFARRKEAKRARVDHGRSATENEELDGRARTRPGVSIRRPSLPGFNSLLDIAGIDADPSRRPSLTSATSFPDLAVLGGPLSSITPTSGSSISYTLSPTSSGRLSRFSSFGFDPRSSLGSVHSSRSSVSAIASHAQQSSVQWWRNKDEVRFARENNAGSVAEVSDLERRASRAAHDSGFNDARRPLEGDRRSSEKAPNTTRAMEVDPDALQRYSRYDSYPFGPQSAGASRWPSGETTQAERSAARRASGQVLPVGGVLGPVIPMHSHPAEARSDESAGRELHHIAIPSPRLPSDRLPPQPQTPLATSGFIGIANAAALANEREREQRRVSRLVSTSIPSAPIERVPLGPTFGPFSDGPRSRVGSLQLAPDALHGGSIYLWADEANESGRQGLSALPANHGSLGPEYERRGRTASSSEQGGSLTPSPSRTPRHDKPYPTRGDRSYRQRISSVADTGLFEAMPRQRGRTTSSEIPSVFASHLRGYEPSLDLRRDSAIPPEGFAPVNRGHEQPPVRLVKVEDRDYPSVLRHETSGQTSSQASHPQDQRKPAMITPTIHSGSSTIMVPHGYTLSPVYAHPGMIAAAPPGFQPHHGSATQPGPPAMYPLGYMGQAGPGAQASSDAGSARTSGLGPSSSTYLDSRREVAGREAQPGPRYECEICHKHFNRPSSLKIHMYSHTGEKPYRCDWPYCTRKFSVQSNLKRHAKVHIDNDATSSSGQHDSQIEFEPHGKVERPVMTGGYHASAAGERRGTLHVFDNGGENVDEEEEDELEEEDDADADMEEVDRGSRGLIDSEGSRAHSVEDRR